jgi:hypothetical protein
MLCLRSFRQPPAGSGPRDLTGAAA